MKKKRREGKAEPPLAQIEWCHKQANEAFGSRPIADIKAPEILAFLEKVEGKGRIYSAQRLKAKIGEVFRYAVATHRAESDPTRNLKAALTGHKTVSKQIAGHVASRKSW